MRELRRLGLGAALALAGFAGHLNAQCSTAGGAIRYSSAGGLPVSASTSPVSSTITVPGGGAAASICVDLNGVTASGRGGAQSMLYAAFLLTSPDSTNGLVLLSATGDGIDGDDAGDAGSGLAGLNISVSDGASTNAPASPSSWPHIGSVSVRPSSYWMAGHSGAGPPLGVAGNWPQSDGSATFAGTILGTVATGDWTLTLVDTKGDPISVSSWDIVIATVETAGTVTSLSSSVNPSFTSAPNGSVTLTASVTGGGAGPPSGTVAFSDNGAIISGCGAAALAGSGSIAIAQCTTTFATEGDHALQASYVPSGSFMASTSAIVNQFVKNHSTLNSGQYCNAGAISFAAGPAGAGTPYPSVINVGTDTTGLTGTVGTVTVTLNDLTSAYGIEGSEFLLVGPDGIHNLEFLAGSGSAGSGQSTATVSFDDASSTPAPAGSAFLNGTLYEPTDRNLNASGDDVFTQPFSAVAPQVPASIHHAQPDGNMTLIEAFNGVNGNGDWALFVNGNGQAMSVGGGWCLDFAVNTGTATSTSVSSSKNPALLGDPVTITATVTGGGNAVTTGTVTFTDATSGAAPAGITGSNTAAVDASGQAAIATSALAEGDHKIVATYNATAAFNLSSGTLYQRIDNATTVAPPNGNQVQFCNTAPVTLPLATGAATPNPSNIQVATLPGSVATVSLQLENFQVPQRGEAKNIGALLVGPLGANLDFFSGTGDNGTVLVAGLYNFADDAGGLVPQSPFGPGSYQPTDYDSNDAFTQSLSNFEVLPTPPYNLAASAGASTFTSVFGNTNGNVIWSLYFNQSASTSLASGAANGWCLTFTVNPPEIAAVQTPNGLAVVQGASAAVQINVQNPVGPGAAGGAIPVTVTDTFPAGLTPSGGSGTGWSCAAPAGQTISCTSSEFIPPGSDFDTLTLAFSVPGNATPGPVSNTAVISGSGLATSVNSNSLNITILPAAVLSVSTSAGGTFTEGQTAEWDVTAGNVAPAGSSTMGTTTVVDMLPAGFTLASFASVPSSPAWTCAGNANVVTCTSTQAVGSGASFSQLQLFVNVPANSPASVTNFVVVYGGSDRTHTNASNGATASSTTGNVIQVAAAPAIATAFAATAAGVGGTVWLSFTIQNPNAAFSLSGIAFTDNLPAGLAVAAAPMLVNNCGGALGAAAGATSIALTGGSLPAGSSCAIALNVQATSPGTVNNATGAISAKESGPGSASNTATLEVIEPPTISAAFSAPSVPLNGTVSLIFTLTNPAGGTAFANIGVTDTLPGGLAVANPNGVASTCPASYGVTVTASPAVAAIAISAQNLPPGASCSASVNVIAISAGTQVDPTANLSATFDNSGTPVGISGGTASASIAVVAPPMIAETFAPGGISAGDSVALMFTIANPAANTVPLTGVGFIDALPAGLTVTSSTESVCNGGMLNTDPATGIILSGVAVPVDSECQFSVTLTAAASGSLVNSTGPVTSANAGSGNSASATLTVAPSSSGSGSTIAVNPAVLTFAYSAGASSATQSQLVGVTASAPFTLTAAVAAGAPWLTVTVGMNGATVTANAAGLAAGTYQSSVLLTISSDSVPISVPVTLTVLGQPALAVSAPSLTFTANEGAASAGSSQSLLLSAVNGNVGFTVSASSSSWLSVSANSSQTPATLEVSVIPGTLAVGTYSGSVEITAAGASNSPLTIPVTLRVVASEVTGSSGIFENSASFATGPGAANTIMAVYGKFTCPAQPSVLVNNSAVEVIGATASQVTFTLPPTVDGETSIDVAVVCKGLQQASGLLPLAAVAPGIFTLSKTGAGQGAAVNQDGTVNGPSHPAPVNTYLAIYGTGFGPYLATSPDGLERLSGAVQAFLGGQPVAVQFAARAGGDVGIAADQPLHSVKRAGRRRRPAAIGGQRDVDAGWCDSDDCSAIKNPGTLFTSRRDFRVNRAMSYSPTHSRAQYHRGCGA